MSDQDVNPVSIEQSNDRTIEKCITIRDLYHGILMAENDKIKIAKKSKKYPMQAKRMQDESVKRLKHVYEQYIADNPLSRMSYFTSRICMLYTKQDVDSVYRTIKFTLSEIDQKSKIFDPLRFYYELVRQMQLFILVERRLNYNLVNKVELTTKMVGKIKSVRKVVYSLLSKIDDIMDKIEGRKFPKTRKPISCGMLCGCCGCSCCCFYSK